VTPEELEGQDREGLDGFGHGLGRGSGGRKAEKTMKNAKILLVEDHPDDAFLTRHALKKNGIDGVTVMHDAGEALNYLFMARIDETSRESIRPRLIILDLRLPKMNGFEFLEAVRADERTCNIPVIVLSSSQYEGDMERCRELGAIAYLTKPLDINQFIHATKELSLI
jgi:CheY-like chemotaxis protein